MTGSLLPWKPECFKPAVEIRMYMPTKSILLTVHTVSQNGANENTSNLMNKKGVADNTESQDS